jgi:hypothetical protein
LAQWSQWEDIVGHWSSLVVVEPHSAGGERPGKQGRWGGNDDDAGTEVASLEHCARRGQMNKGGGLKGQVPANGAGGGWSRYLAITSSPNNISTTGCMARPRYPHTLIANCSAWNGSVNVWAEQLILGPLHRFYVVPNLPLRLGLAVRQFSPPHLRFM